MTGPDRNAGEPGDGTGGGEGRGILSVPRLLSHPADPAPMPPPLRDAEAITSLHRNFARLVGGGSGNPQEVGTRPGASTGVSGGGGVRAKVRARVVAAARVDAAGDRALLGDLVRAVTSVATRVDDVAGRVGNLERLVQEVLDRLSEDLVRVQAALGALDDRAGGPEQAPTRDEGLAEGG